MDKFQQGEYARKLAEQANQEAKVCVAALVPFALYIGLLVHLGRI